MPVATLFRWLKRGWVSGQQDARPPYRWIITADQAEPERLRALHQLHRIQLWRVRRELEDRQPRAGGDQLPHLPAGVGGKVVPDQDDRPAEFLMGAV